MSVTNSVNKSPALENTATKNTRWKVDLIGGSLLFKYMADVHGLTGEQIYYLRQASCEALVQGKPSKLVRIYNAADAEKRGFSFNAIDALTLPRDLILYEGYYFKEGKNNHIDLKKMEKNDLSLLEKGISEGTITEVGIVQSKQGGLGKFFQTIIKSKGPAKT